MIYYQIGAAVIILLLILIGAYRGIIRTLLNLIGLALNAFLSYHIAVRVPIWKDFGKAGKLLCINVDLAS